MNYDFLIVIYIAAGLQSFITATVFVLLKKEKAPHHPRVLAALFFVLAIILLDMGIERTMFYMQYPQFGNIGKMFAALIPGLAYIYVRMITVETFHLRWYDSLHFLPFLIKAGVALFSYHLQPADLKKAYWESSWQTHPINWPEISAVVLLMFAIQIVMLARLVLRHRQAILQLRSDTFDQSYLLIKWFGIAYIIQLALNSLRAYLVQIEAYALMHIITFIMGLWIYLMITVLILVFIARPRRDIALSDEEVAISGIDHSPSLQQPEKTGNDRYQRVLENELDSYISEHKPYLNPNLTLIQLSRKIGVPGRELSTYINQRIGCNFSEYIANLRVNEFKTLFKQNKYQGSITDLMIEVGFNAKSTFNSHFKRVTGDTPSDWIEKNIH